MSETKKPKYKIEPILGMPEWLTPGIVCRVRDFVKEEWQKRIIICFDPNHYNDCFRDIDGKWWTFAEPVVIEEWEPQEGERVAFWNEGDEGFRVFAYDGLAADGVRYFANNCAWEHIARLVYPDGRVIDCACDVETLKTRTEWR